jgi:hypothetical protein
MRAEAHELGADPSFGKGESLTRAACAQVAALLVRGS